MEYFFVIGMQIVSWLRPPRDFSQEDIFSISSDSVFQSEAGLGGALLAFSESGHWFEISRRDLFKLMLLHSALLGRLSPLPITKRAFFFFDADLFCPISETGS